MTHIPEQITNAVKILATHGVGVDECHFSLFVFSPDAEGADGGVQRLCHNSQHEHAIELSTLELWKRHFNLGLSAQTVSVCADRPRPKLKCLL